MRTVERTIIGIVVAGVLSTLLIVLSFIPPAKALPIFPSFVRGGSNTKTSNKMSADEQPQGLNGMDLIIDGEIKWNGGNCTIAILLFICICTSALECVLSRAPCSVL